MSHARLVVLVSGNGTNLQAILDACQSGQIAADVVAVFSNRQEAYGLVRAKMAGVPAIVCPKKHDQDRTSYDVQLAEKVMEYTPDWIILAGWMRILSNAFLTKFPWKVINIHPALPGAFPGTHAIERAYESYQQGKIEHTGVMIHLVPDEGVDNGPVLAQEMVEINKEDTLESLEERIHRVEYRLYVETIGKILSDVSWIERIRNAYSTSLHT